MLPGWAKTFCGSPGKISDGQCEMQYNTSIKPIENVPIVSAATSYDNPVTGDILNETTLPWKQAYHLLIYLNQVCACLYYPLWITLTTPCLQIVR
jgi:hypothetical protein